MGEEGADPIFGFGANGIGAERVNVVGDGTFAEAGGGELEGAFAIPGVPASVEGDLIPRDPLRSDFWFAIDFDIETAGLKEDGGLFDPIISHAVGVIFLLDGADIEKGSPGELGLFRIDGILNHAADDFGGRGVESANHDEVVGEKLGKGANAFVGEVGVGDQAVGGQTPKGKEGEFRIHRGGVGAELDHERVGWKDGGIFGNFQGDAPHQNHDPDGVFLRLLHGQVVGQPEDGIGEDGFTPFQPTAGDKDFVEGLANFGFEFGPSDFFGYWAVESEDSVRGDGAGFGIGIGQRLGVGVGTVKNDDGVGGQVRPWGGWRGEIFGLSHLSESEKNNPEARRKRKHREDSRGKRFWSEDYKVIWSVS